MILCPPPPSIVHQYVCNEIYDHFQFIELFEREKSNTDVASITKVKDFHASCIDLGKKCSNYLNCLRMMFIRSSCYDKVLVHLIQAECVFLCHVKGFILQNATKTHHYIQGGRTGSGDISHEVTKRR